MMKNEQLFEQCLQTKFLHVLLMFPRFSSINLNECKHRFHLLIQKCITDDNKKHKSISAKPKPEKLIPILTWF